MRSERNFFKAIQEVRVEKNRTFTIINSEQVRTLKFFWKICGRKEMFKQQMVGYLKW